MVLSSESESDSVKRKTTSNSDFESYIVKNKMTSNSESESDSVKTNASEISECVQSDSCNPRKRVSWIKHIIC